MTGLLQQTGDGKSVLNLGDIYRWREAMTIVEGAGVLRHHGLAM